MKDSQRKVKRDCRESQGEHWPVENREEGEVGLNNDGGAAQDWYGGIILSVLLSSDTYPITPRDSRTI